MQFEHALAGVEHAAEVLAEPAGDVLDLDLGHQVQVELGPQLAQRRRRGSARARRATCGRRARSDTRVSTNSASEDRSRVDWCEKRRRMTTACRLTLSRAAISASSPLAHHDQFVDELVVGAAPAANLLAQRAFLRLGHLLDDQHLEVRAAPARLTAAVPACADRREHVGLVEPGGVDVAAAVRLGGQRAVDARHGVGELVVAARGEQPLHPGELRRARVGPVGLQRGQGGQQVAGRRRRTSP